MISRIALICLSFALPLRADDILSTLRKEHPRVIVLDSDLTRVREMVEKYPLAKQFYEQGLKDAARALPQPPVTYKLIGPRLLMTSRTVMQRVRMFAGNYRLSGDKRFADRAILEMLTAADFKDWNPSHFLDTAEMSAALGVGYDWLYDVMTPQQRETIRRAIVEKGMKPALDAFEKKVYWTQASHNWANVCAGGLTIGALAIADEEPDIARRVLENSRETMSRPMKTFAPDGGWPEGPGYWAYATQYTILYLAATQSALGTDFGFNASPGFSETGMFRIHSIGPTGKTFNFADASEGVNSASQMMWLARQFDKPIYAAHERMITPKNADMFHLMWFDGRGEFPGNMPTDALFRGVDVAFLRSNWTKDAVFVGFKGGNNKANHAHADLGTFVLDAFGERWACDTGPDDYNLPSYFGKNRWTYYRCRTEGQNTLTINGENQKIENAKAPLIAYSSTPERSLAVADLSAGYPMMKSVRRGIEMLDGKRVIVQDELDGDAEKIDLIWHCHTMAKIETSGATATLKQNGKTLRARVLSPSNAIFEGIDVNIPKPQRPSDGLRKLMLKWSGKPQNVKIVVMFSRDEDSTEPPIESLENWPGQLK